MKHLSKVTLIKWATQINYPPTCVVAGTGRDTVSAQQSEKKKSKKYDRAEQYEAWASTLPSL